MALIKSMKRKRKGTKRFDPSDLKEILKDRRSWNVVATVIVPDELDVHYELIVEGGVLVDILVEVVTHPGGIELTCRLKSGGLAGIVEIPNVDDEVLVAIPEGQIEFCPTIVAFLSGRSIPNPAGQGPALGRTVIVNGEVLVHDGSGGAVPLARADHKHDLPILVEGVPNTYGATSAGVDTFGASDSNTTVLKAK